MISDNCYPTEHFIPLNGEPFMVGRITINKVHNGLSVEIDILQKENRKIFKAVGRLYGIDNEHEALDLGIQKLSDYLNSLR